MAVALRSLFCEQGHRYMVCGPQDTLPQVCPCGSSLRSVTYHYDPNRPGECLGSPLVFVEEDSVNGQTLDRFDPASLPQLRHRGDRLRIVS